MREKLRTAIKVLVAFGVLLVFRNLALTSSDNYRMYKKYQVEDIELKNQTFRRENIGTDRILDSSTSAIVKVRGTRNYLFSATAHVLKGSQEHDKLTASIHRILHAEDFNRNIFISAWRYNETMKRPLKCCYMLRNGTAIEKRQYSHFVHSFRAYLKSLLIRCPFPDQYYHIKGVGISSKRHKCSNDQADYLVPNVYTNSHKKKIGVCAKISYGTLDASKLVEWLEAMKLFGVDKVITYHHNLNADAMKVFQHYRSEGLVDIFPFEVPETERFPRNPQDKTAQVWSDEQVAIFDCQERLKAYKYGVFLDTDEFLIPEIGVLHNSWKRYFKTRLKRGTHGLYFMTRLHLTSWEPSDPNHPLYFGRYMDTSPPLMDRSKYAYRTDEVMHGGCAAHTFKASKKDKRHKNKAYAKQQEATVHHFRFCEPGWKHGDRPVNLTPNGNIPNVMDPDFCTKLPKAPSSIMQKLVDAIMNNVLKTRTLLNLNNPV